MPDFKQPQTAQTPSCPHLPSLEATDIIDVRNPRGKTALMTAHCSGHAWMTRSLLAHGASALLHTYLPPFCRSRLLAPSIPSTPHERLLLLVCDFVWLRATMSVALRQRCFETFRLESRASQGVHRFLHNLARQWIKTLVLRQRLVGVVLLTGPQ